VVSHGGMQIVLDAMRLLDDGKIKNVGPAMGGAETEADKRDDLPVIKGPFVDYTYMVREERFCDGETIVTEGAYGSWIWVILEGEVEILRDTPKGPAAIARLGHGCFIGTFTSLLYSEFARSATARSVGKVHLGLLDTLQLSGEYASLSSDFRRLLVSLAGRLTKITDRALNTSVQKDSDFELPQNNEVIIQKGCTEEALFSIAEGESYLIGRTSKGPLPLLTLRKDDVFGNVSFIDLGHEPHCASFLGSKDLKLNRLDTDSLRKEYDQLSGTFRNLIDNMGSCISRTTRRACHAQ